MKTREERKNDLEVFNYIKDLNNKEKESKL